MQDNELHKLLNEKLDNFEMPVPADGWNRLSELMSAQPARRVLPLWLKWGSVAACALLLVTLGVIGLRRDGDRTVTTDSQLLANETPQQQPTPDIPTLRDGLETSNTLSEDPLVESLAVDCGPEKVSTRKSVPVVVKAVPSNNLVLEKPAVSLPLAESVAQQKTTPSPTENLLLAEKDKKEEKVSNPSTTLLLTEEEAEQLLAQADNDLEQQLKHPSNNPSHRVAQASNPLTLGFLASLNANDKIGSHLVNTSNKVGLMGGQDAETPSLVPPATVGEMQNDLPFSVGLSVAIPLAKRWDFITGIDYTYMHSQRTTSAVGSAAQIFSDYDMHYMGIPAQVSLRIIDRKILCFYFSLGGKMEKGLARIETKSLLDEEGQWIGQSDKNREAIKGLQWSVGGNFGLSLRLIGGLSFYVEPGLSYYIPNSVNPQPPSIRKENPLFFSLSGGLRFTTK